MRTHPARQTCYVRPGLWKCFAIPLAALVCSFSTPVNAFGVSDLEDIRLKLDSFVSIMYAYNVLASSVSSIGEIEPQVPIQRKVSNTGFAQGQGSLSSQANAILKPYCAKYAQQCSINSSPVPCPAMCSIRAMSAATPVAGDASDPLRIVASASSLKLHGKPVLQAKLGLGLQSLQELVHLVKQ